uniref:Protein E10A n=1 Tax=Elephant endotheliotropic herpesvirus 4A TaxID=1756184 RepID=A0A0U4E8S5_9BETA|nr:protein E10A [Elephant endotheliotropic herpesvirus 4A]
MDNDDGRYYDHRYYSLYKSRGSVSRQPDPYVHMYNVNLFWDGAVTFALITLLLALVIQVVSYRHDLPFPLYSRVLRNKRYEERAAIKGTLLDALAACAFSAYGIWCLESAKRLVPKFQQTRVFCNVFLAQLCVLCLAACSISCVCLVLKGSPSANARRRLAAYGRPLSRRVIPYLSLIIGGINGIRVYNQIAPSAPTVISEVLIISIFHLGLVCASETWDHAYQLYWQTRPSVRARYSPPPSARNLLGQLIVYGAVVKTCPTHFGVIDDFGFEYGSLVFCWSCHMLTRALLLF